MTDMHTGREPLPSSNKCVYTVMWGKASTRKHKVWEGDGTVEVENTSLLLKNADGKILGRLPNTKSVILEEGSRLQISGKEVEVLGCVNDTKKREAEVQVTRLAPAPKKIRTPVQRRRGLFHNSYIPLIFPHPTYEHQAQYNPRRLPLTLVAVDACLARALRPHQRQGVLFLYSCLLTAGPHAGAILADEMGLGKTLQCITVIWTLLRQGPYGGQPLLRKVLVIAPSSLVGNWQAEFLRWLGRERIELFVVDQKSKPKDFGARSNTPVMLISYEMCVRYFEDISSITFDLLICDEGHRLKNGSVRTTQVLTSLPCPRRVVLTGTPLQNDLQEFFTLVNFVSPGILGTSAEFHEEMEQPIVSSRSHDAPQSVQRLGRRAIWTLAQRTRGLILRRTQSVLDAYLPGKQEVVVLCAASPLQRELYHAAIEYWNERGPGARHLGLIMALRKVCNHPVLMGGPELDPEEVSLTQHLASVLANSTEEDPSHWEHSGKLYVVAGLLDELHNSGEKVLLISYYTQTLDLLAALCKQRRYKFCRLDGSTPTQHRMHIVNTFNQRGNDTYVFLLSAKAGGVGLNLTGASRLVMYDSDWNPASDLQAMSRVWRDGQRRGVYIYRLLTTGTIEEKMFQRQISKKNLTGAAVSCSVEGAVVLSPEELKDILTLHEDSDCVTHDLMDCDCGAETSELRMAANQGSLHMNQLYYWDHLFPPFDPEMLKAMGLTASAPRITFIFRHTTK